MSVRANKTKQTRSFRLESLEERSLLSVAMPSSVAALVQPMKAPKLVTSTLTGSLTGTHQEGAGHLITTMTHGNLTVNGSTVILAVSGPGEYKLTEVGHAAKWKISGGTATFTDSAGDSLKTTFTGSAQATSLFTSSFSIKGKVTGGSGVFKGATGTLSASGVSDLDGTLRENITLIVKTKGAI